MTALREYLRGVRTQSDVARELGVSARTLQRIEEIALAKLLLGIARELRLVLGDLDDGPPEISPACRISEHRVEDVDHAARAVSPSSPDGDGFLVLPGRAARAAAPNRLPRRFRRKTT